MPVSPGRSTQIGHEMLKRAMRTEDFSAPNIALGPLRWNITKVRREHEMRLEELANAHRAATENRRAQFDKRRQQLLDRHAKQRHAALVVRHITPELAVTGSNQASRPTQPKKFGALRATVENLRRFGHTTQAQEKQTKLEKMESHYWHHVVGVQFEEEARAQLERIEQDEAEAGAAEDAAYEKELVAVRQAMDKAVKATKRSNPRTVDEQVWKASHMAASGNAESLRELLERRGRRAAEERDKDTSWTPLFFAARSGNADCACLLLDYDADVRARDPRGRTALHVAAAYSSREVAALLLEHGAEIDAVDADGQKPVDVAKARDRCAPLVRYLESFESIFGRHREPTENANSGPAESTPVTDDPQVKAALMKLRFKERAFGDDYVGLVPSLIALANAYRTSMGDAHRARDALERAAHITEVTNGPKSIATAAVLNNLGELYHEIGADDEAKNAFTRALDIVDHTIENATGSQQTLQQRMSVLMPPLRNLALLTFTCGEVDTSIPLLRRLLELSEQILRPDYESKLHDGLNTVESPGLIPVLNTLGYAELLDGNTDNARTQYQRVLNISNVHSGSRSLETVQAVEHLAMVEYYAENFDEAGRLFQDAQQILLENGRSQSDEDVRRNIENAATATCRKGPRAFVASDK